MVCVPQVRRMIPLNWIVLAIGAIGGGFGVTYFTRVEKLESLGMAAGFSLVVCILVGQWASRTRTNFRDMDVQVYTTSYLLGVALFCINVVLPSPLVLCAMCGTLLLAPLYYLALGIQLTRVGPVHGIEPGDSIKFAAYIYYGILASFIISVLFVALNE